MRKLAPARASHWDDFLISYRVYIMTGSFHILLFNGTFHVDKIHVWFKIANITHALPVPVYRHSRPQRPRSFWSAPKITTSGQVQHRKSAIHGLPVTLRMLRVKSDKCDWFWSQSIVFTKPFKTGMSLDRARGRDFWC